MRMNCVVMMLLVVASCFALEDAALAQKTTAKNPRPAPPPTATSPQRPTTNTRTAPRLSYGDRCGAEGAGKSVWIESSSRDRSRVTVRETWTSERGERRSRDHYAELAGGEKRRISCTMGDRLIDTTDFKILP